MASPEARAETPPGATAEAPPRAARTRPARAPAAAPGEVEEPAAPAGDAEALAEPSGPSPGDVDVALERAVNDSTRRWRSRRTTTTEETEACIHDADDDAQGSVTVRLVIAPDGSVRSATPRGPASLMGVGRCLADAMRGWSVEVPGARAT